MATHADAEIILKLYELRRETVMREARAFVGIQFNPSTPEEFAKIHDFAHPQNAYWRQVVSFWEMACTLAVEGAVDADLFAKTNGEAFFIRAKYAEISEKATGKPFMPVTLQLIESSPEASKRYEGVVKVLEQRKAAAKP